MMVIKNGVVWQEGEARRRDLRIEEGKILQIAPSLAPKADEEVLDAEGKWLLPGIVDLNVGLRDRTFTKPHLDALLQEALNAGVTTCLLRSDFSPAVDNPTFMQLLKSELSSKRPNLLFGIRGVREEESNTMNDIAILLKEGASVIQEYSWRNSNLLRRIMEYAQMKEVPLFCYPEDPSLSNGGVMHEGEVSFRLGIPGIPEVAEISEVAKITAMSNYYGIKTHLQSLSTKEAIAIVARAKWENPGISCEVPIHHLLLDDRACEGFNTSAKLMPPLRDAKTKEALIEALQEGRIDTITSLHSPRSVLQKDRPFAQAAYGVDALRLFLPLCYTFLVKERIVDIQRLFVMISERPAQILGLSNLGRIEEGYRADLLLFDPSSEWEVEETTSPYCGTKLSGKVTHTICGGTLS